MHPSLILIAVPAAAFGEYKKLGKLFVAEEYSPVEDPTAPLPFKLPVAHFCVILGRPPYVPP